MESQNLLCDSFYCRLCAEENENATLIFDTTDFNVLNLSEIINKYLPVQVKNDNKWPVRICPGCRIQLEATKLFLDLIVEGQKKLRDLFKVQQDTLHRLEKQRTQLEEALHQVNPTSEVKTYTIQSDETGEKFLIQIVSDGPLFPADHELSLQAEGLNKPRRKRGRPPKPPPDPNKEVELIEEEAKKDEENEDEEVDSEGRRKRKIRAPIRYKEAVQGKELDKIFKDEDIIDGDVESNSTAPNEGDDVQVEATNELGEHIIGRMESKDGEDLGELIVINSRPKYRAKPGILRRRRKYQCKICNKEFLHFGRYNLHRKYHKNLFTCQEPNCEFTNEDRSLVEAHQTLTSHTGINTIEMLLVDEPNKLNPTDYNCDKCNKKFSCKQNYEVHCRAVHQQLKPYQCEHCPKSFSYSNSLRWHLMTHANARSSTSRRYPCENCSKIFENPSSLIYHRDSEHSNGRRFVCNKCNKSFKHRQLLQRHQLVHSDERPFRCLHCPAAFKTGANLRAHQSLHNGERKYCCAECGQSFAHKTSLTLHQRWHAGHKPYRCDICEKSFSQKGNLAEHRRIHTGEKPYSCEHCGRSFTTSSQYRLHRKRHTGEKPWRCEFCAKTFLHKETWKSHRRRHLNERPFKCKFCSKAFTESWTRKKHERLHTGEKPYKCDECLRSFSDSSNLAKHRKVHCPVDAGLQLRQLVDQQGNPISLTTQDGQQVPVVTGADESNIQGLLPDGTLVPIDISALDDKDGEGFEHLDAPEPTFILDGQMEFLPGGVETLKPDENNDKLDTNIQFITSENGQEVCLVTTYTMDDEANATINPQFLTM